MGLAFAAVPGAPAGAQSALTLCGGQVAVHAPISHIRPILSPGASQSFSGFRFTNPFGSSAPSPPPPQERNVEYHAVLENRSGQRLTVRTVVVSAIHGVPVHWYRGFFPLAPGQQEQFHIVTLRMPNPTGEGAPVAFETIRARRFTCTFD